MPKHLTFFSGLLYSFLKKPTVETRILWFRLNFKNLKIHKLSRLQQKKKRKTEKLEHFLTWSQEGTLLRYPVARTTESISSFPPFSSSTWPRKNLLIAGTTVMPPDLIFSNAPMSKTGVFPLVFLSCIGPTDGLFKPYFSMLPSTNHAIINRSLSTSQRGSHFIINTANSNVDFPRISLGKTWTCIAKQNKPH